jgi:hypothetical protein
MKLEEKIAKRYLKTAGDVRFIKDHSGSEGQWAYSLSPLLLEQ